MCTSDFMMMMLWHGNDFCITRPLLGESIGLWWIVVSLNKLLNKQFSCQYFEMPWHWCDKLIGSVHDSKVTDLWSITVGCREIYGTWISNYISENIMGVIYVVPREDSIRDHSVYVPSQWEMVLKCNAISHWQGACIEWSLIFGI